MSIRYTVLPCNSGELSLVDDDVDEDISDYYDQIFLQPRGVRPQNGTVLVRVCKKPVANETRGQNVTVDRTEGVSSACELRRVPVASLKKIKPQDAGIPNDVLEKIEKEGKWTATENLAELGGSRRRRQAEGNQTEGDSHSGILNEEIVSKDAAEHVENMTETAAEFKLEGRSGIPNVQKTTVPKESNDILKNSEESMVSTEGLISSNYMDENFVPQNHIFAEPVRLPDDLLDLDYNFTDADLNHVDLSLEYDDYKEEVLLRLCIKCHFKYHNSKYSLHQNYC